MELTLKAFNQLNAKIEDQLVKLRDEIRSDLNDKARKYEF